MSSASLTSQERAVLERFCRICDGITACRFLREYAHRTCAIMIGTLPSGQVANQYPRYDSEDFLAFTTRYRKLKAEREETNVFRVMRILGKVASDGDRKELGSFRKEIQAEAKSWWGVRVLRPGSAQKELLSAEEVEDLLFNAEVFHSDKSKLDAWDEVQTHGPFWEHSFLRFATVVVHYACKIADMIRSKGYLDTLPQGEDVETGA